jgi:hypothetical protein
MSGCRTRQDLTFQYPCSVGSPRFARGTEPRVHAVPPARRGNLKEGVIGHTRFCELWLRDWYYFLRRRNANRLTSPLPNASMLAGSGTTS